MWSSYSKWVWVSKHRRRCWLQLPQVHRTRRRCRTGIVVCACRVAMQFPIRRSWHNWGKMKIVSDRVKNWNWCWYNLNACIWLLMEKQLNLVQPCWMDEKKTGPHLCETSHCVCHRTKTFSIFQLGFRVEDVIYDKKCCLLASAEAFCMKLAWKKHKLSSWLLRS